MNDKSDIMRIKGVRTRRVLVNQIGDIGKTPRNPDSFHHRYHSAGIDFGARDHSRSNPVLWETALRGLLKECIIILSIHGGWRCT